MNSLDATNEEQNLVPIPFCIFKIPPQHISPASKPHHFSPQVISMGPYHHSRHDLLPMQPFKLSLATTGALMITNNFRPPPSTRSIPDIVRKLEPLAPEIRQCYDKELSVDDAALAEIVAVDGAFLVEVLCFNDGNLPCFSNRRVFLGKEARRRIGIGFFRDVMMVENQIPIFALREIVPKGFDGRLCSGLVRFCQKLSPLEMNSTYPVPELDDAEPLHLLDLLYNLILLKFPDDPDTKSTSTERFLESIYHLQHPLILILLYPVKNLILIIPRILSAIPILRTLIDLNVHKIEAPTISSASELIRAGVRFRPSVGGSVRSISFKARTLNFPRFIWNPSSEVVFRNLVAYESMAKKSEGDLILAQYGKLMDGLIRTKGDVEVLREAGIVVCGEDDDEIGEFVGGLFGGIGGSVELKDKEIVETVKDLRIFHANSHNLRSFLWVGVVLIVVAAVFWLCSLDKGSSSPASARVPVVGRVHFGSLRSSKVLAAVVKSFRIINLAGPYTTKSTILSH